MKKFFLSIIVVMIGAFALKAQDENFFSTDDNQEEKKTEQKNNRWVFGGDVGLSFGTFTYIEISPVAAYRINDRLLAGPGIIYIYEKYKPYNFETSVYGGRAVAMFSLFKNINETIGINLGDIVLYGENQYINAEKYDFSSGISDGRGWIDNLLLGGGLYQRFGNRGGGISIMVLFDVTQNEYSSYSNPIIKVGFFF